MAANVETMFYTGQKPWHGLGTYVPSALTSKEALREAGLDWQVLQKDIFVNDEVVPAYKANVRSSDNKVLGIVSDRYSIVQNTEAFEFTDALIGNDEVEVRYEIAGSLSNGKKIWLLAKMPDKELLGDKIEPYLVFTNTHDGSGSIKVALTPIRVVCQNTLTLALNEAPRVWTTKHIGDINSKLHEAENTLFLAQNYINSMEEMADILSQKKISQETMNDFMNTIFPFPEINQDASTRKIENVRIVRGNFMNLYNNKSDLDKFRGTGWGVYNAVADFVGHSEPKRRTKNFKENKFIDLVDGNKMIENTQKFLLAV